MTDEVCDLVALSRPRRSLHEDLCRTVPVAVRCEIAPDLPPLKRTGFPLSGIAAVVPEPGSAMCAFAVSDSSEKLNTDDAVQRRR